MKQINTCVVVDVSWLVETDRVYGSITVVFPP